MPLTFLLSLFGCAEKKPPLYQDESGEQKEYPQIEEVSGEYDFELALLEKPFPSMTAFFYNQQRDEIFIYYPAIPNAYPEQAFKLNNKGWVVDHKFGNVGLNPYGADFTEDGYYDWALSGSRQIKPYKRIIDLDTSQESLSTLIQNSKMVDEVKYYSKEITRYYYNSGDAWFQAFSRKHHQEWKEKNFAFTSPAANFNNKFEFTSEYDEALKGVYEEGRVEVVEFHKQGKVKKPFFDYFGYGYDASIGTAYLKFLTHFRGEQPNYVHFKAPAEFRKRHDEVSIPIGYHRVWPGKDSKTGMPRFFETRNFRWSSGFPEGIYIIRAPSEPPASASRFQYSVDFSGVENIAIKWHKLEFAYEKHEFFENLQEPNITQKKRHSPLMLNFSLVPPGEMSDDEKIVQVGDEAYYLEQEGMKIYVFFDFQETNQIFSAYAPDEPLSLLIKLKEIDEEIKFEIFLKGANKSTPFTHNVYIVSYGKEYNREEVARKAWWDEHHKELESLWSKIPSDKTFAKKSLLTILLK